MVVTKWPAKYSAIKSLLQTAGYTKDFYVTAALKCKGELDKKTWNKEVKSCAPYLNYEISRIKPKWILALGNEALLATTGHSGIMKHRGILYPAKAYEQSTVMGTISQSAVYVSPSYAKGFAADLQFFAKVITGQVENEPDVPYISVMEFDTLNELYTTLKDYPFHGVSYDLETTGFEEYKPGAAVISMAISLWRKADTDVREVWAVPLYHPESPFLNYWQEIFSNLCSLLRELVVRVAFNSKFDDRWSVEFGEPLDCTFDPMLAAHLLDENRSKSLANLSRQDLMAPSWKIDTKDLLNEPLEKVLRYNADDTIYGARLYFKYRAELLLPENKKLARLFKLEIMPVSNELVHSERIGVWIDRERHAKRWAAIKAKLNEIDIRLRAWIPPDIPKRANGKSMQISFNTCDFLRWFIYEHLGLPILDVTTSGLPSLSLAVKHRLKNEHPVMKLLIARTKWARYENAIFDSYNELMDKHDRVHTTFKLHVAVTGRLSSGGGDSEKVLKREERSTNLQNVPTDKICRGIIGAPPGRVWISADYSQIEFRIAAWLANCIPALEAFARGDDIHRLLAAELLKKPPHLITKEERTPVKPVNFGFLFGAWEKTFIETAWKEYQIVFTMDEAKKARATFFNKWVGFEEWHEQQREFVREHGYAISPFGRKRRLPDVYSNLETKRWHAERQGINAPVQSTASELTQISYVLISREIRKRGLDVYSLGTVHDSSMYDAAEKDVKELLPVIKHTMENLPLKKMFGIELGVPIVAEIEVGHHWGEGKELTVDEIYNWNGEGL